MNKRNDVRKKKALGKGMDSIMGDLSPGEESLIEKKTLTDEDGRISYDSERNGVESSIKKLKVDIEWSKEEKIPAHELIIKPRKEDEEE